MYSKGTEIIRPLIRPHLFKTMRNQGRWNVFQSGGGGGGGGLTSDLKWGAENTLLSLSLYFVGKSRVGGG